MMGTGKRTLRYIGLRQVSGTSLTARRELSRTRCLASKKTCRHLQIMTAMERRMYLFTARQREHGTGRTVLTDHSLVCSLGLAVTNRHSAILMATVRPISV